MSILKKSQLSGKYGKNKFFFETEIILEKLANFSFKQEEFFWSQNVAGPLTTRAAYFDLCETNIILAWRVSSKMNMERIPVLQKWATGIQANLQDRELRREAFKELKIMNVVCS